MANLTARIVLAAKPRGAAYYISDAKIKGLQLRVAVDGSKSWSVRYRIGKRQRRYTIGDAAVIPLVDSEDKKTKGARTLAGAALWQVKNGVDPAETKRVDRDAKTFGVLGTDYILDWAKKHKKSWKEDERRITKHLKIWKHRAVKDITRADVRALVKTIGKSAPTEANRVHSLISKMLSFAVDEAIVEVNVVARMKKLNAETSRDRVLSPADLKAFWTITETFDPPMRALWRLRLVTLQRLSEVANATWSEVDLDAKVWEIPAARRKNGKAHRVPLSATAVAILTALRPSDAKSTDYILAGARSKRLLAAAAEKLGLADFRGHDLRRTGTSLMPGVTRFIKSAVLGHTDTSVTGIYDRFEYADEKRIALDSWDRALHAIIEGKPTANVVAFTRGK
jgi:integrase